MKVYLLRPDVPPAPCALPYAHADHALVTGETCRTSGCAPPFAIGGRGSRPSEDDQAYEADARCLGCGVRVGTLRAEVSTVFGVREDERVLGGPWRVY